MLFLRVKIQRVEIVLSILILFYFPTQNWFRRSFLKGKLRVHILTVGMNQFANRGLVTTLRKFKKLVFLFKMGDFLKNFHLKRKFFMKKKDFLRITFNQRHWGIWA